MKHDWIVRDNMDRIWATAPSFESVAWACRKGRTLWQRVNGIYVPRHCAALDIETDEPDSRQPLHYRGEWLVVSRGNVLARGQTLDDVRDHIFGIDGKPRVVWGYDHDDQIYRRDRTIAALKPRDPFVIYEWTRFMKPRYVRDAWLVTSASGRVWARGATRESVADACCAGRSRGLWELVKSEYVLRAVDGKEVQS